MDVNCGIYLITCKKNRKKYVGSSKNMPKRWRHHKYVLDRKMHFNSYLVHCWHKYGEEAFKFEVLELCPPELLLERETFWIKKLNTFKRGFNMTPEAARMPPWTEARRAAQRKLMIRLNKTLPQTEKQRSLSRLRLTQMNQELPQSPERRAKSKVRMERLHKTGVLNNRTQIHSLERREASRKRMKRLWKEGVLS